MKRFSFDEYATQGGLFESDDGEYCLYEDYERRMREAIALFERIRGFVGQEVDGASLVDLGDVEIAIDKFCASV